MISIVIPAHNEVEVITRCLDSLTTGALPGEIEIVVVCNGCTDETAEIALGYAPLVRVIETPVPSKSNALNLGDGAVNGFPRFYVDADISLPIESIRGVAKALENDRFLGAAPRMKVDLSNRGWPIRAYYDIWMRTPYVQDDMLGCGVYVVSEKGRARFEVFPDVIADDCFVRLLFSPDEKTAVEGTHFVMTPPATLRSLIHINVRRTAGLAEMAHLHPETSRSERKSQRTFLASLLFRPSLWPSLGVYLYAKLATNVAFLAKRARGRHREWNRDDSSR